MNADIYRLFRKLPSAALVVSLCALIACSGKGASTGQSPAGTANDPSSPTSSSSNNQTASNAPTPSGTQPVRGTESSAGGGNAVVCFDDAAIAARVTASGELADAYLGNITSIEMLDLYSALKPITLDNPIVPQVIPARPNEVATAYVERLINRLGRILPGIANGIRYSRQIFNLRTVQWATHGLRKISDADTDERMPDGCALVTMAVQRVISHEIQPSWILRDLPELTIDQRLFFHAKHSVESKGALLLHEYAYQWNHWAGDTDSRKVRHFLQFLILAKSPGFSDLEIIQNAVTDFSATIRALTRELDVHQGPPYRGLFATKAQNNLESLLRSIFSKFVNEIYPSYLREHPDQVRLALDAQKVIKAAGGDCSALSISECHNHLQIRNDLNFRLVPESVSRDPISLMRQLAIVHEQQRLELYSQLIAAWRHEHFSNELANADWVDETEKPRIIEEIITEALLSLADRPDHWISKTSLTQTNCPMDSIHHTYPIACIEWSGATVNSIRPKMTLPPQ